MTQGTTHLQTRLTGARSIAVERTALPADIPEGHVRLRLTVGSLCGTDLHYYRTYENAGFKMQRPTTLGHEACAVVEDANGGALRAGQLVALDPIVSCGACAPCRSGSRNYCTNKVFPGSATTVPHRDGFFQERLDWPAACCHPVLDTVDPAHLTFAEPLACTLHALDTGGMAKGDRVLVVGCGPMGLLAVAASVARGAQVSATDLRSGPVSLAERLGATGLAADREVVPEARFDIVVEASGSPHGFNAALGAAQRGGAVILLSNIQPSATVVDLHRIMLKELRVVGSFQFDAEFRTAVEMIASGAIDVAPMIAARFALADLGPALELMLSGEAAGKILLGPEAAP